MQNMKLIGAAVAALATTPCVAADEDVAIWNAQFIKFYADKDDKIFVRLESQQRLNDDVSNLGQFIIRPYVAYQVNDDLQVGGGYAYFRTASAAGPDGFIFEHRVYTEVNARLVDQPGLKIDTRTRLESRQFANIGDNSWRIRSMVQATVPVADNGLSLVFFTEPFLNLNDQPNFAGGFEQTRNFAGVLFPVTDKIDFMTGYMNLYQPREGRDDRMDHVVWLKTFVKF